MKERSTGATIVRKIAASEAAAAKHQFIESEQSLTASSTLRKSVDSVWRLRVKSSRLYFIALKKEYSGLQSVMENEDPSLPVTRCSSAVVIMP